MNRFFTNGAVETPGGRLLIYYGSADMRLMLAGSTIGRMVDCCMNTPSDGLRPPECVKQRIAIIARNREFLGVNHA